MDKIACMRCYCHVVKEGGFSAAARKLGISKVLVSRNIAALENDLGVRLLQRTTRKMSPTDDGRAYYERCLALIEDFDSLEGSIKDRGEQISGKLRLSIPSEAFTSRHLLPFFTEFAARYPEIELELMLADRYVDIVDEGFDAALRIGNLADSSLIARKLADMEAMLCASPRYLELHPAITQPLDIQSHPMVVDSNHRSGASYVFQQADKRVSVKCKSRIRANSASAILAFLKEGFGIGLCPSFMLKQDLESGELVRLLNDWSLGTGGIYLVYSHRKHLSAKVRVLTEEISRYFEGLNL
jgi:DNA-binding transcriptional LysR family regulator